jgi:conjugative transposon TraJ protein
MKNLNKVLKIFSPLRGSQRGCNFSPLRGSQRGCNFSPLKGARGVFFLLVIPTFSHAQSFSGEIQSLQSVLDQLYNDMLPLCSKLISVGRGLAGFAALWYIASRVWRHLANAEPIDFYPLLRPFALGFCIMIFPWVIALMNGMLKPTVTGTAAMVTGTNNAIAHLLKLKEEAIKKTPAWQIYVGTGGSGDRDKWYRYTNPAGSTEGMLDGLSNDIKFAMDKAAYNFRHAIKQWMSEILHLLYEAAALCINTIRTFYLIVLAILGPLVFGFAVFDGFQHTLTTWIARYITVYLWLPVANIFGSIIGKIQENMLRIDIQQVIKYGDTFFSATDTAYLIFLVMAIVGYFTVPSIASYVVHAGGGYGLLQKTSLLIGAGASRYAMAGAAVASGMGTAAGYAYQSVREKFGNTNHPPPNNTSANTNTDPAKSHQHEKLSGKPSP